MGVSGVSHRDAQHMEPSSGVLQRCLFGRIVSRRNGVLLLDSATEIATAVRPARPRALPWAPRSTKQPLSP